MRQQSSASDNIRLKGIMANGYGQIPKIIMSDPGLPLGAKAVYAYLVSYTGHGNNTAFPSLDRILSDLNISSNTYYKYMDYLTENMLITVEQRNGGSSGKGFKRNIYTIEAYAEPYVETMKVATAKEADRLELVCRTRNLYAAGYGYVPRSVMTDPGLSLQAKAVYAYICAFSGTSYVSVPSKNTALYHLGISDNSYIKYTKELVSLSYITKHRKRSNGRFSEMIYTLNQTATFKSPHPKNSDTAISYAKNSDTIKQDTVKCDTNKNGSLSRTALNKICLNQSIPHKYLEISEASEKDRSIEEQTDALILDEIAAAECLPYHFCSDPAALGKAVRLLTAADSPPSDAAPVEHQRYGLFVTALTEMLCADSPPTCIRGAKLSYAKIVDALTPHICAGFDEHGDAYAEAFHLYDGISMRYKNASAHSKIKSPLGYMKAMIWTELTTGMLEVEDKFTYDMAIGG